MLRAHKRRLGALFLGLAATASLAAVAGASAATRSESAKAATTVRIWTDADRLAAVRRVANAWGARRGVTVEVVQKQFGDIRDQLRTVKTQDAPDVITAAHDWTGQLAVNGLVVPLFPKKTVLKQVPAYARSAFTYGKLYGMPVALENVGLFVNTRIAKVPKTWKELERRALAFQRRGGGRVGLAVQQGSGGDAYHMYPFFSGLCGYVFGKTNGRLNPSKLGVANKKFLRNSGLIDRWNRERLINSKIDGNTAQQLFTSGKAAYWVTGPWNIDTVRKAGIRFRIIQVPRIKCRSVPFLGVQGFMVTKYAAAHGAASAAKDLVSSYMGTPGAQFTLANANKRYPANVKAGKRINDGALRQIGRASAGGVPMPNIPQMNSVWEDLGAAWVKATKGAGATKARIAFSTAARNIRAKIASG